MEKLSKIGRYEFYGGAVSLRLLQSFVYEGI